MYIKQIILRTIIILIIITINYFIGKYIIYFGNIENVFYLYNEIGIVNFIFVIVGTAIEVILLLFFAIYVPVIIAPIVWIFKKTKNKE